MTVGSTSVQTAGATGSGTTGPFAFTFRVQAYGSSSVAAQLEVVKVTIATGAETTLTYPTDFSVSVNNDQDSNPGGSITLTSSISSAYKLYVRRAPAYTQETDLTPQGPYNAQTVETQFDQVAIQLHDLLDRMKGTPHLGVQKGSGFDGRIRQSIVGKAGYLPVVNDDEDGFELVANNGSSNLVTATGGDTAITLANYAAYVIPVEAFGAVGDGVTDDLASLQEAYNYLSGLGRGKLIGKPERTYKINGRLTLKDYVDFDLNGATIKFTNTTDGLDTESNGVLSNGRVSAEGISSYVGPAWLVDDNDGYARQSSGRPLGLESVRFVGVGAGASAAGTAVKLHGRNAGAGNGIWPVRVLNCHITNFAKGIHCLGENGSWVNGNLFQGNTIYGADVFVHCEGTADGNLFIGNTIQPNTTATKGDHAYLLEGANNRVIGGFIWDWDQAAQFYAIECSGAGNRIIDAVDPKRVKISADNRTEASTVTTELSTGTYLSALDGWLPPRGPGAPAFIGYDDFLCWADKRYTITWSGASGEPTNSKNAFRHDGSVAEWASLDTATVKIDVGAATDYLYGIGLHFPFGKKPDNVHIEASTDDVSYTDVGIQVTDNEDYLVALIGKSHQKASFRYLRITVSNDTPAQTYIGRIFGYSAHAAGYVSLPVDDNSARGVVSGIMYSRVLTEFNGVDDTVVQDLLPSGASGVSLEASTQYEVEGEFFIERGAGTNAHTTSFLFDFTGTIQAMLMDLTCANPNAGSLGTPQVKRMTTKAAVTITASNNSSTEGIVLRVRGSFRTTNAGVLKPQFQYSAAPGGAPAIKAGSFFRVWRVATGGVATSGPWA